MLSSGHQGAAYLFDQDVDGRRVRLVVKKAAGGLLTGWIHRHMLRREARVYARMADIKGVPHSPGMLDDTWLLLEFIEAESLQDMRFRLRDADAFYAALLQVLHDFHAVGVAHGDLKRKDNVLVTPAEQPVVIDFGTAVLRDGGLLDRLIFRLSRRLDYNAWIKVKYQRDYSAISPEDLRWYRPTMLERGFSRLQKLWRVLSLRQLRKRWQRRKALREDDG